MADRNDDHRNTLLDASTASRPTIDTKQLFGDTNEVLLVHDEVIYRLRITKAGKLILTK